VTLYNLVAQLVIRYTVVSEIITICHISGSCVKMWPGLPFSRCHANEAWLHPV